MSGLSALKAEIAPPNRCAQLARLLNTRPLRTWSELERQLERGPLEQNSLDSDKWIGWNLHEARAPMRVDQECCLILAVQLEIGWWDRS